MPNKLPNFVPATNSVAPNHLQLAHNECEVQLVNVWAAQAVPHEMVLNISNRVREVAPNSVIAWGNVEH